MNETVKFLQFNVVLINRILERVYKYMPYSVIKCASFIDYFANENIFYTSAHTLTTYTNCKILVFVNFETKNFFYIGK